MEIYEIRHKNYIFLFERFKEAVWADYPTEPERGMLRRFAARVGISEAYMSHLNTGFKKFGDKTARNIEQKLGLENGYMDKLHDEKSPRSKEEEEFLGQAIQAFRDSPGEARAVILRAFTDKLRDTNGNT